MWFIKTNPFSFLIKICGMVIRTYILFYRVLGSNLVKLKINWNKSIWKPNIFIKKSIKNLNLIILKIITSKHCQQGGPSMGGLAPTIMNFASSYAFFYDGFDMIWDSRYYCWLELNAYEQDCAMGFHTHGI